MSDTRTSFCLSDADRPDCHATIHQVQQPNGVWRPPWCDQCNLAYLAREEKFKYGKEANPHACDELSAEAQRLGLYDGIPEA